MRETAIVHLIDGDEAALGSLGHYLEAHGLDVRRYARAERFLAAHDDAGPLACVVSDVRLDGLGGLELQHELGRRGSPIPVILTTGNGDIETAVGAIKMGAWDYLQKPVAEHRLLASIRAALADVARRRAEESRLSGLRRRHRELSERQQQVMALAVAGRTNKEIGLELGISPRTVEIYRAKVMERMGAATLAELVRIAVRLDDGLARAPAGGADM
ncbi:MAG: response regulator transcription factor [Hyphomicrobiaceae bacterium]